MLFTRYPEAGTTKTRLIPSLGAEGAALLHKKLTERIVLQAHLLSKRSGIQTSVYFAGGNRKKMTSWLGSLNFIEQTNGDLGRKMRAAFVHSFAEGVTAAILIGSDIPDISADLLHQAFASFATHDVVIGPSQDGGYYLIGLIAQKASELMPLLFENMRWSEKELFTDTIHRLEPAKYKVAILPTLRDIDVPEDLFWAGQRELL